MGPLALTKHNSSCSASSLEASNPLDGHTSTHIVCKIPLLLTGGEVKVQ